MILLQLLTIALTPLAVMLWLLRARHFKGEADRLKNGPDGHDRPGDSPEIPYGTRAELERILEARLDE